MGNANDPPVIILSTHTIEDAQRVQDQINGMLTRESELTDEELDLLKLLVYVKSAWEREHVRPIEASPVDVLNFLMEQQGWTQAELVRQGVFRTRSQASQVVRGERRLTYDHAAKLAALFHVSPAVFFPRLTH
jgi:HTH-type transcriptional regulator/antitoxin HigA